MRRFLTALFVASTWATVAQASEVGSIHGSIPCHDNACVAGITSIAGVTIEVREGDYRQSVVTNARGSFTLLGIPPGRATVVVNGGGWVEEVFYWCVRANESDTIPLWLVNNIHVIPYFQGYYNSLNLQNELRTTTDQYNMGGC